jgi:Heterokaryon incompatibility protein Het-C
MASSAPSSFGLFSLIFLLYFADSAHAFGAGNIGSTAKIEGTQFRHGDIEDVLLTILMAQAAGGKKFGKLDVKRVHQLSSPRGT